jgi:hypothetical protein
MAYGTPSGWAFTARWDGTTFVDESLALDAAAGVHITRGRASIADDGQPGVLSASLYNETGRYTADNPSSALYPYVQEGVLTRFSVTRGASTSFRHRGRLSVGAPDLPGGELTNARVAVESVDMLGTVARRRLRCDFVEQWINIAETDTVDLYPFEGSTFENLGSGTGTASLVRANSGAGRFEVAGADGINLDSAATVTASSSGLGPVLVATTSVPAGSVNAIVFPFRTGDRNATPSGADKYVAAGLKADGTVLWSIRMKINGTTQTDLNLYDSAGAFVATLYFGFAAGGTNPASNGDDQWFTVRFLNAASTQFVTLTRAVDDVELYNSVVSIDARATRTVVLGGLIGGSRKAGNQTACITGSYGALVFSDTTFGFTTYLSPSGHTSVQTRFADMNLYCGFASSAFGTRNRDVWRKNTSGRTGYEVLAELVRTTGCVVVASRATDDAIRFYDSDVQRLPTVALSVDVDQDADGSGGFPWRKGDVPSYVTATYPGGEVTYQDPARARVDDSVDTCAADSTSALEVASARANTSRRLRLEKLVIDLATASNDLWVAVMSLEVGDRIRVNLGAAGSLAVQQYGVTYVDVYAVGWTEHYGQQFAFWEIDTVAADDPVEGVWDDAERGRWSADGTMTVTSGTAVGTTATGTIVVTTTGSNPTWSTTAGDYPLDVDWNGERCTVTSAPAGASSPQTLTLTARGVAPSVARVHAAGEPIDVWTGAAWTI